MWTENARNYFFKSSTQDAEADQLFLERYCSWRMRQHMEKNGIIPSNLRKVLNRISEIVPELDQSTPGWSRPHPDRLQVLFGRAHLQWRSHRPVLVIHQPRFGLYGFDGRLYLWTDRSFLFDADGNPSFFGYTDADWLSWPGSDDGKVYYSQPLLDGAGEWNVLATLENGSPFYFLIQELQDRVGPPQFVLQEAFGFIRRSQRVPEEFVVVYPRISEQEEPPTPKVRRNGTKKPRTSSDENPKALDKCEDIQPPNDVHFIPNIETPAEDCAHRLGIESVEDLRFLTDVPEVKGRFYVYALIDPTQENTPFYIGKGFHDRAWQHFKVGVSPDTIPEEPDFQEDQVNLALGSQAASILAVEEQIIESNKTARIKSLINEGETSASMVRLVARGLSEAAAFAIEALLIKSVYGLEALTNAVGGHHEERFRAPNEWGYQEGFDLSVDAGGVLLPDASGKSYVYVLRDPSKEPNDPDHIFYVGKGIGNRLCQHFIDAGRMDQVGVARLDRLRELLKNYQQKEIGRIVAWVDTSALAYVVESFYIKFVVGRGDGTLTNIQSGHLYGMFRSKGDWEPRHGFDLPTEVGGGRRELLDAFLGEGLDTLIYEVMEHPDLDGMLSQKGTARLIGAGELAVIISIRGVSAPIQLRIQVRCSRRIKLFLTPQGNSGKKWIRERFAQLGLISLLRKNDDMFSPACWTGARNLTDDLDTAVQRAVRLIQFARVLQSANTLNDLDEYRDLLVSGDQ